MNTLASRKKTGRRHPLASAALLIIGLVAAGGASAAVGTVANAQPAQSSPHAQQLTEQDGAELFRANCASCHGMNAEGTEHGTSLIGVGAASVDFQVMTGRMPMAFQGPQALQREPQFTQEQSDAMGDWIASLAPGPERPAEEWLDTSQVTDEELAEGGALFRINCAMCHNVAGAGGALTEGKFAPHLRDIDAAHIYEAMQTGPQNMPVFNDNNISPEQKRQIIAYLHYLDENPSVGGFDLGALGPVSEGLFIWIFGLGGLVGVAVWLTSRPN
ncbi:cytochrome bc1 complex diheme cytochrome c subunit [Agrococcus carbonis]|uniref:cytochrome bc1 complex diheme cytochrome c subunit n=1 Tax=Agrococcus carbonis TaxID=684552 RepID=UPI000B8788CC|nr:c-type cytochrome [Agrococcus carbonis]